MSNRIVESVRSIKKPLFILASIAIVGFVTLSYSPTKLSGHTSLFSISQEDDREVER